VTEDNQGPLDDAELAQRLVDQACSEGVSLTGPGGLLGSLTKRVLETALEGEMDGHLGYAKGDPAGAGSGNSRNGKRAKTVVTEVGPVDIDCPATVTERSTPRSCASGNVASMASTSWCCRSPPRV
jgi:putative transposase